MIRLENENKIYFAQVGMNMYIVYSDEANKINFAYIIEQSIANDKMIIKQIYTSTSVSELNPLGKFFKYNKEFEKENLTERLKYVISKIAVIPEREKEYLMEKITEYLENTKQDTENQGIGLIKEDGKISIRESRSNIIDLPFEYNGKTYNSITSFIKEYNIPCASFYDLYKKNKTLDEIVEKYKNEKIITAEVKRDKKNKQLYEYLGQKMTLRELSDLSGIPYKRLHQRIHIQGWTVQDAVETPIMKVGEKR